MEKADFIKRLVALRVSKGASARDMSLSLGQSAGYINNIENGVNYPSMTVFFYICDYLGISPKEFFALGQIVARAKLNIGLFGNNTHGWLIRRPCVILYIPHGQCAK